MLKAQEVEQFKVRGCLSKPKKSQYYQAILIYTDDAGEEYRVSRSTKESSKIKAQKVMLDMAAELEERLHRTDPSSLFADFMEYWLREVICNEVEVTTLNGYRMNLENHIIPYFKPLQLRLRDLRAVHLTQFCEEMSHKKKADGNLLSGSSIKKLYSNLRTALDYAVTHELIDQNPARIAKAPKAQAYEASYLSIPQITSLWKGCKGSIIEPAVFLTSIYGFRRGEICGLRWENVDIPQRNLRIYETRTQAQGVITKGTKNSASKRTMPIPEAVADYLLLLQERQREAKQAGGEYWCESGYVVIDECGKPISIARLNKHFTRLLERCGLPKVRFHDLRHPYVKHTTKIFSLRLMDFQAQACPDARRKTRGACQLLRVGQSRSPVRPLCNRKRFSCLPPQSKMSWILYAISMRLSGYTSTRSISSSASSVVSASASKIALDASLRLSCRTCSSCFCFTCANTAA